MHSENVKQLTSQLGLLNYR